MKIAVSIPDAIFAQAELLATRHSSDEITHAMNRALDEIKPENGSEDLSRARCESIA